MSARAEQLVLEYLSRVADQAHGVLRSEERLRFISRLRASIDQQRQAAGALDLAGVRRVLAKFGDPTVLVERERGRLEAARQGGAASDAAREESSPSPASAQPSAPPPAARSPGPAQARARPPRPPGAAAPRRPGRLPARAAQATASDLMSVVRRFRREALALALLGPGGLLLPFPLWLIGAAIGLTSWAWSRQEKLIGLAGPLIVTAACIGLIGTLNKNPSIPVDLHAYLAAAQANGQLLMRFGAAAGALFLGARLVRGYRAAARRGAHR